jgi:cell wall-associated NlpC family hydrolase
MINKSEVITEAREWIDTPFHHQGRLKGIGVDCVGLIIGVAKNIGIYPKDFNVTGYPRSPDGTSLMALANVHMTPISRMEMSFGDVVVVRFGKEPQHFGIIGDYRHGGFSIIHAAGMTGRVIETRLMFSPSMEFVAAFSLPGVI